MIPWYWTLIAFSCGACFGAMVMAAVQLGKRADVNARRAQEEEFALRRLAGSGSSTP